MNTFMQQILNILITPPGNLVYHLILAFAVAAGLQSVLLGRRGSPSIIRSRIALGLGLILVAQLILFLSSGLAWQQVADPQRFLPPLDRAVTAFSLVWIVWLWCFPTPSRLADGVTAVLSIGVIILALFTVTGWMAEAATFPFNASYYDWGWQIFSLAITFIGMMVLLIGRPSNWGTGLAALVLILAGYVLSMLTVQPSGDFSGWARLAQLCAYPLLPVLAQRLTPAEAEVPAVEAETSSARRGPDQRVVQAWMQLAAESGTKRVSNGISRAVAQTMLADLCFLIGTPDNDERWHVQGGYDLVGDDILPEIVLEHEKIPNLAAALQRGRSVRLSASGNLILQDRKTISEAFGLAESGDLLAAPLISGGRVLGGIVLLTPYSNRDWTPEEQSYLVTAADSVVQILQRAETGGQPPAEVERLRADLRVSQSQMETLRKEKSETETVLEQMRAKPAEPAPQEKDQDLESLLAVQKESQETIAALTAENERLQAALTDAGQTVPAPLRSHEVTQVEAELHYTLQQVAHLQNALAQANMKIMELEHQPPTSLFDGRQEMLSSIAEDLRQPMSSVVGYIRLLLVEEAGKLAPAQRNYLDRVRASVERLDSMLNDLICVASMHDGEPVLATRDVNLAAIVDQAVAANSILLREKKLTLKVDLPETMPELKADPDALQQILVDLLRNAGSTSPQGGTVNLRVAVEQNGHASLLMQVGDTGGGISPEDMEKIFTALTRADEPLLEGVADGGYGLAITQALVKAHGGEIWVDNEPGVRALYNVRLPMNEHNEEKDPPEL